MSDDPTLRILDAIAQMRTDLREDLVRVRADVQGSISSVQFTLMGRMDRLQDTISAVKDDITVNFEHSGRVEKVARAGADETRALADQVMAMERQIRRLNTRLDDLEGKA